MKYFDKFGLEITEDLWCDLLRNRRYVLIEYHAYGPAVVDTQWIGIQTHLCQAPTLFSTRVTIDNQSCWFWHTDTMKVKDVREFHFDLCKHNHIPLPRKR